jgi:hypothetical protein
LVVRTEAVATGHAVPDQLRQNVLVIFAGERFDEIRRLPESRSVNPAVSVARLEAERTTIGSVD